MVDGRIDGTESSRGVRVSDTIQTAVTRAELRERTVQEAIHSGEMEGLRVDPVTRSDADAYIAGHIGSDELVARAQARYGLG